MTTTLEIARFLGEKRLFAGTQDLHDSKITGYATSELAGPCDVAWALTEERASPLAGLVLATEKFNGRTLVTPRPRLAFMLVLLRFFPETESADIQGEIPKMGAGCVIGGDGFTFEDHLGRHMRFPHRGGVTFGEDVELGSNVCIDRGSIGYTKIGYGVRIDNLVHIAHNVEIGSRTIIVAGSVIGGSTKIGQDCYIGMGSRIRERLTIGDNVVVGMGSVVVKDIPSGECWKGSSPASFYRRSDEVTRP